MALPNAKILIHQVSRRLPGPGDRHRDPRQGDHRRAPAPRRDHRQAHRAGPREGRAGHRARLLHERRGGQGVRHHRPGDLASTESQEDETRGTPDRLQRTAPLQLLRQVAAAGQEADRRPRRLHLRRVHRSLQRDHRRGAHRAADLRPREPAEAEGDLRRPQRVRGRPGAGQAHALGRGLQPLQARADDAGRRRRATSSCRSRTSCCSARPAAARRCSPRRSRGSSTSRSRSPTPRR